MYLRLKENGKLFEQLIGYEVADFESLYQDFESMRLVLSQKRLDSPGRQNTWGAGRKHSCDQRDELLSVLLWTHLHLHPTAISQLLNVHVSTFARIRERVLTVLHQMNVRIKIPDRTVYRELSCFPELLQLATTAAAKQA